MFLCECHFEKCVYGPVCLKVMCVTQNMLSSQSGHVKLPCHPKKYYYGTKHVKSSATPPAALVALPPQRSSFGLTRGADWPKARILVWDGLIKLFVVLSFSIRQQFTSQSVSQPGSVACWARNSPFCPQTWRSSLMWFVWMCRRVCMCVLLFFSHCIKTKPQTCLLMWILLLWYFCVISLDQNNNELPGQKNKVQQRWTTTPVPSHSIVASYGHVLKVENDEKQSNTPGPASEHCLEATTVLHSQQVNWSTEHCGLVPQSEEKGWRVLLQSEIRSSDIQWHWFVIKTLEMKYETVTFKNRGNILTHAVVPFMDVNV